MHPYPRMLTSSPFCGCVLYVISPSVSSSAGELLFPFLPPQLAIVAKLLMDNAAQPAFLRKSLLFISVFIAMIFWRLNVAMYFVSFNVDGCKRSCRTEVFAGTASYTLFCIYPWNNRRVLVILVLMNIFDGFGWTVPQTVEALHAVCDHHAKFWVHHCMSYLYRRLFLDADRPDCSGRTYLRAFVALRTAVTSFV